MRATQHGLTWSLPDAGTHCTATALGPIVFSKFLLIWVMYIQCTCVNKYVCVCVHACLCAWVCTYCLYNGIMTVGIFT